MSYNDITDEMEIVFGDLLSSDQCHTLNFFEISVISILEFHASLSSHFDSALKLIHQHPVAIWVIFSAEFFSHKLVSAFLQYLYGCIISVNHTSPDHADTVMYHPFPMK